jgi:hypothetical protein
MGAMIIMDPKVCFCSLVLGLGGMALGSARAAPFPSTVLVRHGFDGTAPNDTCCESRLVGWGPKASPVVLSSGWVEAEGAFRFALELHDPSGASPVELYSMRVFREDDSFPGVCPDSMDLLRCVWTGHASQIQRELARAKVKLVGTTPLLALPPYSVEWTSDTVANVSTPFSFDDSAGRLVFRIPDTSSPGLHLLPVGLLKTTAPHGRLIVLRLAHNDGRDDPLLDVGVRFLPLPEAAAPGGIRQKAHGKTKK